MLFINLRATTLQAAQRSILMLPQHADKSTAKLLIQSPASFGLRLRRITWQDIKMVPEGDNIAWPYLVGPNSFKNQYLTGSPSSTCLRATLTRSSNRNVGAFRVRPFDLFPGVALLTYLSSLIVSTNRFEYVALANNHCEHILEDLLFLLTLCIAN